MEHLLSDLRQALRLMRKSPAFTLVAALVLALGIGANTAIFSVVNAVLLKPLPYANSDRIVRVMGHYPNGNTQTSLSIPKLMAYRNAPALGSVTAYDFAGPGVNLGVGERPHQVKSIHVSQQYFRVFGTSLMAGREFSEEEDRPGGQKVAILSYGLWKSDFGGSLTAIGSTVKLNGDPYVVVGVTPANFQPDPPAAIFIPLQADPNSPNQGNYLSVAARLKPGETVASASAQLKVIGVQFQKGHSELMSPDETATAMLFQESAVGDVRLPLLILLGAVGFVLLIACANVANLLLARSAARQREIAIRGALGATRWRVVRQLLTESLALGLLGGVLGLAVGSAGIRALISLAPPDLPRIGAESGGQVATMDWTVLAFTLGVALFTGLLFGIFPAIQTARTDVNSVLKETGGRSGSGRHHRMRSLLVIAETALALILLCGAGLLMRTFAGLKNVDPGFDPHNVLTMATSLAGDKYSTTAPADVMSRQAIQRIEALPGVQAAALTLILPVEGSVDMPFDIEGKQKPKGQAYNGDEDWVFCTPHYFDTFRIRLLRGRAFVQTDMSNSTPVVVINEAMAKRYWGAEDPVGRRITIRSDIIGPGAADRPRQVVGVVASVRQSDLSRPEQPIMYVPLSQVPDAITKLGSSVIPFSWVVRTSVEPSSLGTAVQREIQGVDSQLATTKIRTMEAVIRQTISRQSFNMTLLSIFAGLALLLAAIGLYGLMSYTIEQRTQELGIRMALGAAHQQMVGMVVWQGMRLALIGVGLGLAAAYGLARLLSSLLFGVKASDPVTFSAVALLLTLVALLATYIPARRAARIDPLDALRYE